MGQVYVMTDKAPTKDVPCTHPMCENLCRVTKFYSSKKAKCPEHGGVSMDVQVAQDGAVVAKPREVAVVQGVTTPPLEDNRRLGKLYCPVCPDSPLEILACTDSGHVDFGCQTCQTIVGVSFGFNVAQVRSVPDRLKELVREFNIRQVGTMDMSLARKLDSFTRRGHDA